MKTQHFATDSSLIQNTLNIKTGIKTSILKVKEKGLYIFNLLANNIINTEVAQIESKQEDKLLDAVNKARYDWLIAKANFQQVSDIDLVDQAIYAIAAAEKKYLYLLKMARKDKVKSDLTNIDINRMMYKANEFNM